MKEGGVVPLTVTEVNEIWYFQVLALILDIFLISVVQELPVEGKRGSIGRRGKTDLDVKVLRRT